MKAALVTGAGQVPVYGEFKEPERQDGMEVVAVRAAALTQLTRGRASGAHYSAEGVYPAVVGTDGVGVTEDGRRVYFVLPEAPFGAMAERSVVRAERCIEVPAELDDVTAAAVANPGMSAWAALKLRAGLKAGETVLVNGATGAAGKMAVRLAKFMGAGRVIATGRNEAELERVKGMGADAAVRFALEGEQRVKEFEGALRREMAPGVDVVIDYLWGTSARTVMSAVVKTVEDGRPVRFVQVGSAAGEETVALPAAALRSSSLVLMGSGLKSVPMKGLLGSVAEVFRAVGPAGLAVETEVVPLREVGRAWGMEGKKRVVFTV